MPQFEKKKNQSHNKDTRTVLQTAAMTRLISSLTSGMSIERCERWSSTSSSLNLPLTARITPAMDDGDSEKEFDDLKKKKKKKKRQKEKAEHKGARQIKN